MEFIFDAMKFISEIDNENNQRHQSINYNNEENYQKDLELAIMKSKEQEKIELEKAKEEELLIQMALQQSMNEIQNFDRLVI